MRTEVEIQVDAKVTPDDAERCCHLLPVGRGESMVAICGHDCTGRSVHSTADCVLHGHIRCFECARRARGGIDRFLDDLLNDSPF